MKKIINKGYLNGAPDEYIKEIQELEKKAIKGTLNCEKGYNCNNQYSFDVEINNEIVTIIYLIDSGD